MEVYLIVAYKPSRGKVTKKQFKAYTYSTPFKVKEAVIEIPASDPKQTLTINNMVALNRFKFKVLTASSHATYTFPQTELTDKVVFPKVQQNPGRNPMVRQMNQAQQGNVEVSTNPYFQHRYNQLTFVMSYNRELPYFIWNEKLLEQSTTAKPRVHSLGPDIRLKAKTPGSFRPRRIQTVGSKIFFLDFDSDLSSYDLKDAYDHISKNPTADDIINTLASVWKVSSDTRNYSLPKEKSDDDFDDNSEGIPALLKVFDFEAVASKSGKIVLHVLSNQAVLTRLVDKKVEIKKPILSSHILNGSNAAMITSTKKHVVVIRKHYANRLAFQVLDYKDFFETDNYNYSLTIVDRAVPYQAGSQSVYEPQIVPFVVNGIQHFMVCSNGALGLLALFEGRFHPIGKTLYVGINKFVNKEKNTTTLSPCYLVKVNEKKALAYSRNQIKEIVFLI